MTELEITNIKWDLSSLDIADLEPDEDARNSYSKEEIAEMLGLPSKITRSLDGFNATENVQGILNNISRRILTEKYGYKPLSFDCSLSKTKDKMDGFDYIRKRYHREMENEKMKKRRCKDFDR